MMRSACVAAMAWLMVLCVQAFGQTNQLPQGTFQADRGQPKDWVADSKATGWMRSAFSVKEEEGRSYVTVSKAPAIIKAEKPIDPAWAELKLSVQTRRQGIKPGKNRWDVPMVELDFLDAQGKSLLDWKKVNWLDGDTQGWQPFERSYPVPAQAVTLVARIGFKAEAGTADFADLAVTVVQERSASEQAEVRKRLDEVQMQKQAESAAAETQRRALRMVDTSKVTGAQIDESGVQVILHVDASASTEGDGSEARPLRTLGAALKLADGHLKAGRATKIKLAAGTYREGNYVIKGGEMNERRAGDDTLLVIEGNAPGNTILSGSDEYKPTGWKTLASGDKPIYTHPWNHDFGNEEGPWGQYNPKKLLGHRSEMVFVNGQPLRQVILEDYDYKPGEGWSGKGQHTFKGMLEPAGVLEPGTFGVAERDDHAQGNTIFVCPPTGVDWSTALVEVTARRHILHSHYKSNLVLRNLVMQHAASTHSTIHAALMIGHWHHMQRQLQNNNILLDRVIVRHNNGFGGKIGHGKNITVRDSVFVYNGHSGLNTGVVSNVLMENCDFSYNNWRGHLGGLYGWAVAGTKQHQTRDSVLRHVTAYGNMGPGIWYDVNNTNCTIENAVVVGNRRNIFLEISDGPFLLKNVLAVADRHVGLVLTNHGHLTVEDSIFHGARKHLISLCCNDNRGSSNSIEAALGLEPLIAEGGEVVGDKPKKVHLVGPTKFINSIFVNPNGRLIEQDPSSPNLYQDWLKNLLVRDGVIWHSGNPKPFGIGYTGSNMTDFAGWRKHTGTQNERFAAVPFAATEQLDFRITGSVEGVDVSRLPAMKIDPARIEAIKAFFASYNYGGGDEYKDDPLQKTK